MPDLSERLRADQVASRKAANKDRTLLLGTVLAALKNQELDLGRPTSEADEVGLLRKQIKQRRDSEEQYRAAGRSDLADRERREIEELTSYLPPEVDPEVIRASANAAVAGGATELGSLMGVLMAEFRGKADGREINRIAREALEEK